MADLDALRQALHDRQVVDQLGGVAERGGADQIGRDRRLPLAVVAVDAGRALVELDVGDDRERHAAALAALPIGTRICSSTCMSPRAPSSSCTRIGT